MPADRDYPCTHSFDTNADGVTDSINFYKYATDGRTLELDQDDDADGHLDHRNTFLYDSQKRASGTLIYNNDDSLVDVRVTITWDGDVETIKYDFSDDGTVDFSKVYTWDAAGQQVSQESYGADGKLSASHQYTRDTDEKLLSDVSTTVGDPSKGSTTTFGYDEARNLISSDEDDGSDGSIEFHSTINRDASGLAQTATVDSGAGVTLASYAYEYDDKRRLVKDTKDTGADGTIDTSESYTFECWK